MSDPTYRIDVTHEPSSPEDAVPYVARASRFTGEVEIIAWGESVDDALTQVRDMMAMNIKAPQTFYTDALGNFADPPVEGRSVKA